MIQAVSHLVADEPGEGIEAMVGQMRASPLLAPFASGRLVRQERGQMEPPRLQADIIVSHLPVSWRNLAYLTALRALHPATPLIHVEHLFGDGYVAGTIDNRDRFDALVGASYALFDMIVALNAPQERWILRHRFAGLDRVVLIEPSAPPPAAALGRAPGNAAVLAAIGRFDRASGFDILIDAFIAADRDDLTLRLHGEGPRHSELVARARGHERIEFADAPADRRAAFAAADGLAVPARFDASGLVALEALAAGLPVLTAPIDASAALVRAGALVVPENSSRGWREALARCDLRTVDIEGGRRHAEQTEARFAEAWCALIDRFGRDGIQDAKSAA